MPGFVNRPSRVSPGRKRRIHVVLSHMLTHNFYILGILFLFLYNRQYLTVTWGIRNNFFRYIWYLFLLYVIRGRILTGPGSMVSFFGTLQWRSYYATLLPVHKSNFTESAVISTGYKRSNSTVRLELQASKLTRCFTGSTYKRVFT